jgi:hypothetical protein
VSATASSSRPAAREAAALAVPDWLWAAGATLVYAVTAVVLTWPMPAHIGTSIFGQGGDAWADLALWRELVENGRLPFLPTTLNDFNAPAGYEPGYALYVATWASAIPRYLLMLVFGAVPGYNLFVLAGYVATGVSTFLLARRLSRNAVAALIAGWAFAFWPFAVAKGQAHLEFAHGWVFILLVWRMLELHERPSIRNGIIAGAAATVCMSYNPYFLLMGVVVYATLIAGDVLLALRDRDLARHVKAQLAGVVVPLGALVLYGIVNTTAPSSGVRSHPISELYTFSARLGHYLVPTPDTILVGDRTQSWWTAHLQGASISELGLYVGVTTLALALLGVGFAIARRLIPPTGRVVGLLVSVGLVAGLFSAPPTFQPGGLTIYMPSWFVFQVTATWRVFSRFGMIVMMVVALLAAIGLARLVQGRPRPVAGLILAIAACAVVVDLWSRPPAPTIALPQAPVYEALAREPAGAAVEYPLFPNTIPEYQFAINQDLHDHPLLNGYGPGTSEEARALWLAPLADADTAPALSLLGVRYVIVNRGTPPGVAAPGRPGPELVPLERDDGRELYRNDAPRAPSLVWPATNFWPPEGEPDRRYAWMTGSEGELGVLARCRPCDGELRLRMTSFAQPRRVRVLLPDGPVVLDETVAPGVWRRYRAPLRFDGDTRLLLTITPGSQPAGAGDPRSLGVAVYEPRFVTHR